MCDFLKFCKHQQYFNQSLNCGAENSGVVEIDVMNTNSFHVN